ncbi:MAG: phosphoribosylformylglycinamidine synthase subunit PurL [Deltaproteobacteria bacterium]|nr:MAG: phosphoribosylformylglycinamidine synthase subunit PurL [Deltaproteobacteria bacterium]
MVAITPRIVAAHGLSQDEYARIRKVLGRDPNIVELGIFSAMWSEHCSYKSSRRLLRHLPTKGPRVLQGPGENAGVIDVGGGLAVAFKMESHNHPSYIEPYQGAATGVGGILRDVFTMGARPIASMNALRFGDPSHPKTARLLEGVVAGIAGYGNCIGVPTVAGEIALDASFNGNCLVNAFTLGLLKSNRIFRGTASGVGNPVIYIGARTGRDGIHGATMASAEFDQESESKRPTVQVGDPFMEKLLLEACLELFKTDCLVGIQDMGAAGLTSSSVEMASRAGSGLELDVDAVPRRETGMTPYEVMLSESQERMLLVAKKGREKEVFDICDKWDLAHAIVGRVTDTGKLVVKSGGDTVAELPIAPLTDDAPAYDRPRRRPAWQDEVQKLGEVPQPGNLVAALKAVLASPTVASKEWVYRQYDHMVRIGTAVRPGQGDAAVVRFTGQRDGGVAISVGCNSRWCYLDPRLGAAHAVAETARNVSCVGGEPLAVTDCLNFGNPERPEIMWQFEQACLGIADACAALQTPVVSGNVSLYNETEGKAVFPTPMIGMVGLMDDCAKNAGSSFLAAGDRVAVVGGLGKGHLGGSEYLKTVHGKVAGVPPPLDFARERAVQKAVRDCVRAGRLKAAHDCSDGGLAVAVAEMCFGRDLGCRIALPASQLRPDALLFGEDASRIVISFAPAERESVEAICKAAGAPLEDIGQVGGPALIVEGVLEARIADLRETWSSAIPKLVGEGIHKAALEGVP